MNSATPLTIAFVVSLVICAGCGARGGLSDAPAPDAGPAVDSEYCAESLATGLSRIRVTRTTASGTVGVRFANFGSSSPSVPLSLPTGWQFDGLDFNGRPVSLTLVYGMEGSADFSISGMTEPVSIQLSFDVDPVVGGDFRFSSNSIPFQASCP